MYLFFFFKLHIWTFSIQIVKLLIKTEYKKKFNSLICFIIQCWEYYIGDCRYVLHNSFTVKISWLWNINRCCVKFKEYLNKPVYKIKKKRKTDKKTKSTIIQNTIRRWPIHWNWLTKCRIQKHNILLTFVSVTVLYLLCLSFRNWSMEMITMAVMVVIVDQTEASSVSIWRSKEIQMNYTKLSQKFILSLLHSSSQLKWE